MNETEKQIEVEKLIKAQLLDQHRALDQLIAFREVRAELARQSCALEMLLIAQCLIVLLLFVVILGRLGAGQ